LLAVTCKPTKALNIGQSLCLQTEKNNKSGSLTSGDFKDASYLAKFNYQVISAAAHHMPGPEQRWELEPIYPLPI
jgi:hypothetical protein